MLSPFSVNVMRDIHVLRFSLFMTFGITMVKLVLQLFKKCWAKAKVANTNRAEVNFFRIKHQTTILHHLLYAGYLSAQQFFRLWTLQPTITICRLRSPGERPCESFTPSAIRHQHALHNLAELSAEKFWVILFTTDHGTCIQDAQCNELAATEQMHMANDWSSVCCFLLIERKEVTHQRTYI